MASEPVLCPTCGNSYVVKHGQSAAGKQRYKCHHPNCSRSTFIRHYFYRGYWGEVKQQIVDMAINGSGIRDTAKVLGVSPTTVIEELKKFLQRVLVNEAVLERLAQPENLEVVVQQVEEAEMDEMWSFVGNKKQER
ncbi:IS1-like element transposase [Leptolyngbya sp. FACHB-16]|uniref:IS1-like element transposase n=1 Tax=unclassified Leptolyngbya TaxID=2650499 RepID=UPI001F55952A|nr:IS1-like element transposase [Leptolyngbya sp. FACHB-16]